MTRVLAAFVAVITGTVTLAAQVAVRTIAAPTVTLSDDDLSQIVAFAQPLLDRDVWLVRAAPWMGCCGWNAQAYGLPDRSGSDYRRGRFAEVRAGGSDRSFLELPRFWTLSRDARSGAPIVRDYAQVALPGRAFGDVRSEVDENLPFAVNGEIDDATLVSLVRFLRAAPLAPASGTPFPSRPWAIGVVSAVDDVASRGRRGVSDITGPGFYVTLEQTPSSGVAVTVQRANGTWVIRGVSGMAA